MKSHNILSLIFVVAALMIGNRALAGSPTPAGEVNMTQESINATMHHIGDANEFHIVGDISLPLPCIAYSSTSGLFFSLSNVFEHGTKAKDGYMMYHGVLYKIKDFTQTGVVDLMEPAQLHGGHDTASTPHQTVDTAGVHSHDSHAAGDHAHAHGANVHHSADGKLILNYKGTEHELEAASTIQGITSWYDFSITKNVFAMFLAFFLLFFIFRGVSNAYITRRNQSPKGLQSLLEPVIIFLRDDVAKPSIGPKWEKYFPYILSLFFFILINNLVGLVPFFPGSANVTGNLGTTLVLAVFTFLVVNLSGNKHYWQHIFWMPGVPTFVKFLLAPIELIGIFLKPITLLIRLFANITAGHIIILSLVGLIFIFNSTGQLGGAPGGIALAIPFVFALNFMELLVAFLQAYIFSLLTCLYIGTAVEEHHHDDHHEEAAHH